MSDAEPEKIIANTETPALEAGALYVVATPIGNLGDLSERAAQVLRAADIVLAEDTRHSRPLMNHVGSKARMVAVHEHNEQEKLAHVRAALEQGQSIALISDAGTPLISDPGYQLVKALRAEGFSVQAVPGACAMVAALSVSGLQTNRFAFEGFLPAKSTARKAALLGLRNETRTLVFYEAPHRVADTITDMAAVFGPQRPATLARELTKLYEEVVSGELADLQSWTQQHPDRCRGEMVLVIGGAPESESFSVDSESLMEHLLEKLSPSDAAKVAAKATGDSRRRLYDSVMQRRAE